MDDPGLPLTPLVDGALVPCWNWRDRPGLYSGKHHRTGLLDHFPDTPPMADKGCTGLGMITPERKPVGGELTETQKQYHKASTHYAPQSDEQSLTSNPEDTPHRLPKITLHLPRGHRGSHRT